MYPARWFPVSGYTTDRFAAEMRVTVPTGYHGARQRHRHASRRRPTRRCYTIKFEQPSFPGSIAIVKDQPARVSSRRRHHVALLPRTRGRYGAGLRRGDRQDHDVLHRRLRPSAVRESDGGGDRGRRAQRLRRAGHDLPGAAAASAGSRNGKLLANQVSRQWWEEMVSPATRNHLWLDNGLATYCGAAVGRAHSRARARSRRSCATRWSEALTIDNVPMMQSARLEDLFAGIVGADRQQGRGGDEHAALRRWATRSSSRS